MYSMYTCSLLLLTPRGLVSHTRNEVKDVVVHIESIYVECSINYYISLLERRINHNFVITTVL